MSGFWLVLVQPSFPDQGLFLSLRAWSCLLLFIRNSIPSTSLLLSSLTLWCQKPWWLWPSPPTSPQHGPGYHLSLKAYCPWICHVVIISKSVLWNPPRLCHHCRPPVLPPKGLPPPTLHPHPQSGSSCWPPLQHQSQPRLFLGKRVWQPFQFQKSKFRNNMILPKTMF